MTAATRNVLGTLFDALAAYSPVLVGTFPLGIDVEGSDLDIACEAYDLDRFEMDVRATLGVPPCATSRVDADPLASVTVTDWNGLAIEVFGQPVSVYEQRGFRHMIVEGRLLAIGGSALRDQVRRLKRSGVKTEPAFAMLLGLDGDPYQAMLALESWSSEQLAALVNRMR
ncbi:MAG: DUF4269 domain-containing protein [Kofleriaceae bacterium]